MSDAIKLSGVGVDCPNAGELAPFYAEITGGTVTQVNEHWASMSGSIDFWSVPNHQPRTDGGLRSTRHTWTKADGSEVSVEFDEDLKVTKVETGIGAGERAPAGQPGTHRYAVRGHRPGARLSTLDSLAADLRGNPSWLSES